MTKEEYEKGKIGLEQYYLDLATEQIEMLLLSDWEGEFDSQVAMAIWLKQHDIGTCPDAPPTKEQLVKALKLLSDYGGYVGYTNEKNTEEILKHWNDEEKNY